MAETHSGESEAALAYERLEEKRQAGEALKWEDIRGIAAPSLLGEDAQEWVTRTRREGDGRREAQLRR